MGRQIAITQRCLFVVEGPDEKRFLEALCRALEVDGVQFESAGGKDAIRRFVSTLALTPGFERVTSFGIVRDAEESASGAFQSASSALQAATLVAPTEHGVFVEGAPRTGIFVLPDGESAGMLETLLIRSVRESAAWPCVEEFFGCLEEKQISPKQPDKAAVLAYLAAQEERTVSHIGVSAQRGMWDFSHSSMRPLVEFIRSASQVSEEKASGQEVSGRDDILSADPAAPAMPDAESERET